MKKNRPILLLFFILFLLLSFSELVQKSMYNDGIWYAIISNNLALGHSSFWNPRLTETISPLFYGHPPLVFGIQSLFFNIFGGSIATERIYSFFTFVMASLLIVGIWKNVLKGKEYQSLWALPLFFWMLNEVTYHYYASNILENTLSFFALAAIYFFYKSRQIASFTTQTVNIAIGSIFILFSFLSKGFVGLFPLSFFFIYSLINDSFSIRLVFRKIIAPSFFATLVAGTLFGLMLFIFPEAKNSLMAYFKQQVVASISGEHTVYHHRANHFYIIKRLFQVLIPTIGMTILAFTFFFFKKGLKCEKTVQKDSLLFLAIGVSASFPLMVSSKQAVYYLLPSIPYFAIAFGLIISSQTHIFITNNNRIIQRVATPILWVGVFLSLIFCYSRLGTINKRDKAVLTDVEDFSTKIPPRSIVGANTYSAHLVGYLYRLNQISIDTTKETSLSHDFFITEKEQYEAYDMLDAHYSNKYMETLKYDLFYQSK